MPNKEDRLWIDLAKPGSGLCLTLALVSGTSALKLYTYDAACHGGWGPCSEVPHLERTSSTNASVMSTLPANWNSYTLAK